MLTLRLVLSPLSDASLPVGEGGGCWPSPSLCQDRTSWRSVLGAEVSPESSGAAGTSFPEQHGTEHCGFLYNQSNGFCWVPGENLWAYFALCQLPCPNAPHTARGGHCWTTLKEFITCRANRTFSVPIEQRMYQELGIQVPSAFSEGRDDTSAQEQPSTSPHCIHEDV